MKKLLLLLTAVLMKTAGLLCAQTTDEATQLAHTIEAEVKAGKSPTLDHIFDIDKLTTNIFKYAKIPEEPAFVDGFKSGFSGSMGTYGTKIVSSTKEGGYKLLRVYQKDGRPHMLFRMVGASGLNYHDYELTKTRDSIKASDCFVYTTDENLSLTMGNLLRMSMAGAPNMKDAFPELDGLVALSTLRNKGDYEGARQYYDKLNDRIKDNKAVQVIYIAICQRLDKALYQQQLEHYAKLYPAATNGYLMMVDLYYMKKDYNKGLEAVNKIDSLVGKDPFLDCYRGLFYKIGGQKEKGEACFERAYQYDSLLVRGLKER